MADRVIFSACLLLLPVLLWAAGCKQQETPPVEQKPVKQEKFVIIKSENPVLTPEQRSELGFPDDIIPKIEASSRASAEPFFVTVVVPSENLKGDEGFEKQKLSGFSVRTQNADDLISSYRSGLRVRGFLIFKSHRGYGSLPDIVTIVRGNNSYDLLELQATEAVNYGIDTKTIIKWLKARQNSGSFFISGAGPDWVEARFVRPPKNSRDFAAQILSFAPDVRGYGSQTPDKLAEEMKRTNGFFLVWD